LFIRAFPGIWNAFTQPYKINNVENVKLKGITLLLKSLRIKIAFGILAAIFSNLSLHASTLTQMIPIQQTTPIVALQEGETIHITKDNIESVKKDISIIWPTFEQITTGDVAEHNMEICLDKEGGSCTSNLGSFHIERLPNSDRQGRPVYLMVPGSMQKDEDVGFEFWGLDQKRNPIPGRVRLREDVPWKGKRNQTFINNADGKIADLCSGENDRRRSAVQWFRHQAPNEDAIDIFAQIIFSKETRLASKRMAASGLRIMLNEKRIGEDVFFGISEETLSQSQEDTVKASLGNLLWLSGEQENRAENIIVAFLNRQDKDYVFRELIESLDLTTSQNSEGAMAKAERISEKLEVEAIKRLLNSYKSMRRTDHPEGITISPYIIRLQTVRRLMEDTGLSTKLSEEQKVSIRRLLAREYLDLIVTESELRNFLSDCVKSGKPFSELEPFLQEKIFKYFVEKATKIVSEVRDGVPDEEERISDIYMAAIRVYRFRHIKDRKEFFKDRKKLLAKFVLLNIRPAKLGGSNVRDKVARRLAVEEVLASEDPAIFQPALEIIIEILAYSEQKGGNVGRLFFEHYYSLLKSTKRLPRFAKALVNVLIKSEHNGVVSFEDKGLQGFSEETRRIIKRLRNELSGFRRELMACIKEIKRGGRENTPIMDALLSYIESPEVDRGKMGRGTHLLTLILSILLPLFFAFKDEPNPLMIGIWGLVVGVLFIGVFAGVWYAFAKLYKVNDMKALGRAISYYYQKIYFTSFYDKHSFVRLKGLVDLLKMDKDNIYLQKNADSLIKEIREFFNQPNQKDRAAIVALEDNKKKFITLLSEAITFVPFLQKTALETLVSLCKEDPYPYVRIASAQALGQSIVSFTLESQKETALETLVFLCKEDSDPDVRRVSAQALGQSIVSFTLESQKQTALDTLVSLCGEDPYPDVRITSAQALLDKDIVSFTSESQKETALDTLVSLCKGDSNPYVRIASAQALLDKDIVSFTSESQKDTALETLVSLCKEDSDPYVRIVSAQALGQSIVSFTLESQKQTALETLVFLCKKDPNPYVRKASGQALLDKDIVSLTSESQKETALDTLVSLCGEDSYPDARKASAQALGQSIVSFTLESQKETALDTLVSLCGEDSYPDARKASAQALGQSIVSFTLESQKETALETLVSLCKEDPYPYVRKASAQALGQSIVSFTLESQKQTALETLVFLCKKDPNPYVRRASAQALGQSIVSFTLESQKETALDTLVSLCGEDPYPDVRITSAQALLDKDIVSFTSESRKQTALETLVFLCKKGPTPYVRRASAQALLDKDIVSFTSESQKETALDTLVSFCKEDSDPFVRKASAQALGQSIVSLTSESQKETALETLVKIIEDETEWDIRLKALEILDKFILDTYYVIETELTGYSRFCQGIEEVLREAFKNSKIDTERYINSIQPFLLKVYMIFQKREGDLKGIIQDILVKRKALGLFRFLEISHHLEGREEVERLAKIFLSDKDLGPVNLPSEAGVSFWLGRSLVVPLSFDRWQVFKYPKEDNGEKLVHEKEMIDRLRVPLGLPIESARIIVIDGQKTLVYICRVGYFDYAGKSYPWQPLEERIARHSLLCQNVFGNIFSLFSQKLASETLLYLSHDIPKGKGGSMNLRNEGGVGEIDNPHIALRWANWSILGIRDLEHITELSSDYQILQNIFEGLLASAYSGIVDELSDKIIADNIRKEFSNRGLCLDEKALLGFISQLRLDLKDPHDVFWLQRTEILPELEKLAKEIFSWPKDFSYSRTEETTRANDLIARLMGEPPIKTRILETPGGEESDSETEARRKSGYMHFPAKRGSAKFLELASDMLDILEELNSEHALESELLNEMEEKFRDSCANFVVYRDKQGIPLPTTYPDDVDRLLGRFAELNRELAKGQNPNPRFPPSFVDILLIGITALPILLGVAIYYRAEIYGIGAKIIEFFISMGLIRGLPKDGGYSPDLPQIGILSKISPINLATLSEIINSPLVTGIIVASIIFILGVVSIYYRMSMQKGMDESKGNNELKRETGQEYGSLTWIKNTRFAESWFGRIFIFKNYSPFWHAPWFEELLKEGVPLLALWLISKMDLFSPLVNIWIYRAIATILGIIYILLHIYNERDPPKGLINKLKGCFTETWNLSPLDTIRIFLIPSLLAAFGMRFAFDIMHAPLSIYSVIVIIVAHWYLHLIVNILVFFLRKFFGINLNYGTIDYKGRRRGFSEEETKVIVRAYQDFYYFKREGLKQLIAACKKEELQSFEVTIAPLPEDYEGEVQTKNLWVTFMGIKGFIPGRYLPEPSEYYINKFGIGGKITAYLIPPIVIKGRVRPVFAIDLERVKAEAEALEELRDAQLKSRVVKGVVIKRNYRNTGWFISYKDIIFWGLLLDSNVQPGLEIEEGNVLSLFVSRVRGKIHDSYIDYAMRRPRPHFAAFRRARGLGPPTEGGAPGSPDSQGSNFDSQPRDQRDTHDSNKDVLGGQDPVQRERLLRTKPALNDSAKDRLIKDLNKIAKGEDELVLGNYGISDTKLRDEMADEIAKRTEGVSVKNLFINNLLVGVMGGLLLFSVFIIRCLVDTIELSIVLSILFFLSELTVAFGLFSLSDLTGVLGKYTYKIDEQSWFRRFLFNMKMPLYSPGYIYLYPLAFESESILRYTITDKIIHLLKDGGYIKDNIVANAFGLLRLFESYDCDFSRIDNSILPSKIREYLGYFKEGVELGKRDISAEERYRELKRYLKREQKSAFLGGIAYGISQRTGNVQDRYTYLGLIGQGMEPKEAESLVRSNSQRARQLIEEEAKTNIKMRRFRLWAEVLQYRINELETEWNRLLSASQEERKSIHQEVVKEFDSILRFIDGFYRDSSFNKNETRAVLHPLKQPISGIHAIRDSANTNKILTTPNLRDWNITDIIDKSFSTMKGLLNEYVQFQQIVYDESNHQLDIEASKKPKNKIGEGIGKPEDESARPGSLGRFIERKFGIRYTPFFHAPIFEELFKIGIPYLLYHFVLCKLNPNMPILNFIILAVLLAVFGFIYIALHILNEGVPPKNVKGIRGTFRFYYGIYKGFSSEEKKLVFRAPIDAAIFGIKITLIFEFISQILSLFPPLPLLSWYPLILKISIIPASMWKHRKINKQVSYLKSFGEHWRFASLDSNEKDVTKGKKFCDVVRNYLIENTRMMRQAAEALVRRGRMVVAPILPEPSNRAQQLRMDWLGPQEGLSGKETTAMITKTMELARELREGMPRTLVAEGSSQETPEISQLLGWISPGEETEESVEKIKDFVRKVGRDINYERVTIVGEEGKVYDEAVATIVGKRPGYPEVCVLESTQPQALRQIETNLEKTLFVVSSPGPAYEYLYRKLVEFYKAQGVSSEELAPKVGKHFVAVGETNARFVEEAGKKFLRTFNVPQGMSVPYSIFGYEKLVVLALAGVNIRQLVESGARGMEKCREEELEENPGAQLAAFLEVMRRTGRNQIGLILPERLKRFGKWWQERISLLGIENTRIIPVAEEELANPESYGKNTAFIAIRRDGTLKSARPGVGASLLALVGGSPFRVTAKLRKAGYPVFEIPLSGKKAIGELFAIVEFATALSYLMGIGCFRKPGSLEMLSPAEAVGYQLEEVPSQVAASFSLRKAEPLSDYSVRPEVLKYKGTKVFVVDFESLFDIEPVKEPTPSGMGIELKVKPKSRAVFKIMEKVVKAAEEVGNLDGVKFAFVSSRRDVNAEVMEEMLRDYMSGYGLSPQIDNNFIIDERKLREVGGIVGVPSAPKIRAEAVFSIITERLLGRTDGNGIKVNIITDDMNRWQRKGRRDIIERILWVVLNPAKEGQVLSIAEGLVVAIEGRVSKWLIDFIKKNYPGEAEMLLPKISRDGTIILPATPVDKKYLEGIKAEERIYKVQA